MHGSTASGPLTWIVVMARCRECNKPGPTVEKQPETTVRVTFTCTSRTCRGLYEQRQTL